MNNNPDILSQKTDQCEESTNELIKNPTGAELIEQKTKNLRKFIKYYNDGGDLDFQKTRQLFTHLPQTFLTTVQKEPGNITQHIQMVVNQLSMMLKVYNGEVSQRTADNIIQGSLDTKYLDAFLDKTKNK